MASIHLWHYYDLLFVFSNAINNTFSLFRAGHSLHIAQKIFESLNYDNYYLGYSHLIKLTGGLYDKAYEKHLSWRNCMAVRRDYSKRKELLALFQRVPGCEFDW